MTNLSRLVLAAGVRTVDHYIALKYHKPVDILMSWLVYRTVVAI